MTRIAFIINSMGSGGAERVLQTILADSANYPDLDVHLVLLDDLERFREIPPHVTVHQLDCQMSLFRTISAVYRVLQQLKPQVGVSFLIRANTANAIVSRLLPYRSVLLERMHLSSHLKNNHSGMRLLSARLLPRLAYRFASAVSGVSQGVTTDLAENFAVDEKKLSTIENPFDLNSINTMAKATSVHLDLPHSYIVAVGRLAKNKDYPTLIEAYRQSGLSVPLLILGEGPEEQPIRHLIRQAGLCERVRLMGYVRNPLAVVAQARFYVSASKNEGFPNALVEAMCLGVPVISTDCPSGPAEILSGNGIHVLEGVKEASAGILVPTGSPMDLAIAMRRMLRPDVSDHYRIKGAERAADFDQSTILKKYWSLFIP